MLATLKAFWKIKCHKFSINPILGPETFGAQFLKTPLNKVCHVKSGLIFCLVAVVVVYIYLFTYLFAYLSDCFLIFT